MMASCQTLTRTLARHAERLNHARAVPGDELPQPVRAAAEVCVRRRHVWPSPAARAQHLENIIKPALTAGHWVLCDRFTDATFAYQGGGRQMDWNCIETLQQLVQGSLQPDLTLYLDMAVSDGLDRVRKRGVPDRFETQGEAFFNRVRAAYQRRAVASPERFRTVNAGQPLDAVQQELTAVLKQFWDGLQLNQEPSAGKEPSADREPSANEEPAARD